MKSLFTLCLFILGLSVSKAQYCGNNGYANCVADGNFSGVISDYNSFKCVKRGEYFSASFQIRMPTQIYNYPIQDAYIDSIGNLPCNLCWNLNNSGSLTPGAAYCVEIKGSSDDMAGLYKLTFFGHTSTFPVLVNLETIGMQFYIRVIEPTDDCPSPIVQPGDLSQVLSACSNTGCSKRIPFITTPAETCNPDSVTYTVPSSFKNVAWDWDSTQNRATAYGNTQKLTDIPFLHSVSATDTLGCKVYMESVAATASGIYQRPHIAIATYDSSINKNVIVWNRDDDDYAIDSYFVYSAFNNDPIQLVKSIGYNNETLVLDEVNTPRSGVIKYELVMTDRCGESIVSDVFAPPHLNVDTANGIAHLHWNFVNDKLITFMANPSQSIFYTMRLWKRADNPYWTQTTVDYNNFHFLDSSYIYGLSALWLDDTLTAVGPTEYMIEIVLPTPAHSSPNRSKTYGNVFSNVVSTDNLTAAIKPATSTEINFTLVPNPVKSTLRISTDKAIALRYSIYNTLGQILHTQAINASYTDIPVSELPNGVYFIKLQGKNSESVKKFIKE